MKTLISALFAASIIFVSCQRDNDDSPNNFYPGKLIKTVQKTAVDSVVTQYTYDNLDNLIRETRSGFKNGADMSSDVKITRNGSGIILTMVEKAAYLTAGGVDSVLTSYKYDLATQRYASAVNIVNFPSFTVIDSVWYNYNATGFIIRDDHKQVVSGSPGHHLYRQEYVYSGINLDSIKNSDYHGGTGEWDLVFSIAYQHDLKINPLNLGKEAILLTRPEFYGFSNVVRTVSNYPSSPSMNYEGILTLLYNSHNMPQSGTLDESSSATIRNISYHYEN